MTGLTSLTPLTAGQRERSTPGDNEVNPVNGVTKPRAQPDALATETQRLARHYAQKQTALAALKKSLLHQAFTGAL